MFDLKYDQQKQQQLHQKQQQLHQKQEINKLNKIIQALHAKIK